MSHRCWRTNRVLVVGLLVAVLVVLLFSLVRLTSFLSPHPVLAAWQLARQSGNYHFAADIVQATLPRVTVTNAGRSSRQDTLRLEGQADLQAQTMHLRLWSQGGSPLLPESGAEVKVENGTTYARQGGSAWEEVSDFTGLFAPAGDFLSYLAGVRNMQDAGSETRAGVRFTRYTFDLNGPVFAEYMREQLQQQMAAEGKLPPGLSFDAPRMFAEMTGDGELWVRTDGLPLRQILRLQFPEQGGEQVRGEITVSFSQFAPLPALSSERLAHELQMGLQVMSTQVPTLIALGMILVLTVALIRWRHSRRLGTVLAVVLCGIILSEPLLMNLRVAEFGATRQAEAAEQAAQRTQTEMQREALAQQARPSVDPHADPLAPAPRVTEALGGGTLAAIEPGGTDSGIDTDGDGLTDFQEARLGTSSSAADANDDGQADGRDSDSDGVSDNDEVRGFTFGGRRWYSDPLDADTNNDGIGDGPEWNGSFSTTWDRDGDGTPDIYDSDNDNDGVPDRLDISPAQGPQRSGTTNVTYGPDTPFTFQINNLRANTPALVDFQLRSTNPDHLWYAFNVLDWPGGDVQGTIMDQDGDTFRDVYTDSQNPANADGDMRLLPTLEIRISTEGGAPTNLPLTDTVSIPLESLSSAGVQGTVRLTQNGGILQVDSTVVPQASVTGLTLLEGQCANLPQTLPAPDNRTVSASGGTINTTLRDLLIRQNNGLTSRVDYAVVARNGNTAVACGDIPLLAYEGNRLIDNEFLSQYGIFVRDAQADGIDKLVYVPLQLVTDPETGARVAFKARMFYQSRGAWARVHTARLVWSVQVLQDVCRTFENNQCSQFSRFNVPQVVQTYNDEWYITGLHVREDHGADLAMAYADPTVANPNANNNRQADLALTTAVEGLARTYLQGANLTMEELRNRLDHTLNGSLPISNSWGLRTNNTTNVLRVVTRTGYPHMDALLADVATSRPGQRSASQAILEDVFSSYGANNFDLNPTLLFIRSERFRAANLDAVGSNASLIGGQLTLNMPTSGSTSIPVQEVRTINWSLYRYLGASGDDPQWAALSTEEHLAAIATRYPAAGIPVSYLDPDPANNAQEQAARLLQFQLYHLAIQRGLQSTVRVDTTLLTNPVPDNEVNDLFQTILTNQFSYAAFEFFFGLLFELEDDVSATAEALTDAVEAVSTLLQSVQDVGDLGELVSLIKPDGWRSVLSGIASLAGLATVLSGVLIILASTVFVLAEQNLATQISVSIIIGGIQLLTLVVKPIYDAIQTLREVAAATQSTTFVAQNGVWASARAGAITTIIIAVISIALTVIFFVLELRANDIQAGSLEFNRAVAFLVLFLVITILLNILYLLPIVGSIIAGITTIIDTFLGFFTDTSITQFIAEQLVQRLHGFEVVVATSNEVTQTSMGLEQVERGLAVGSTIRFATTLRTTARHIEPDNPTPFSPNPREDFFIEARNEFTADNLRATTFRYSLDTSTTPPQARRGEQGSYHPVNNPEGWQDVRVFRRVERGINGILSFDLWTGVATAPLTRGGIPLNQAGVNRQIQLNLNYAAVFPALECWLSGLLIFDTCNDREVSQTGSQSQNLVLDVFPARAGQPPMLADFYTLEGAGGDSYRLSWGGNSPFPRLPDADGDGLRPVVAGGNDPNDLSWDTDSDGLADSFELRARERGVAVQTGSADSDGDGLTDPQEIAAGSDPARADTDADGLLDRDEVYHQVLVDYDGRTAAIGTWTGGWEVTIQGQSGAAVTTRVSANPADYDSDDDGLTDLLEYELRDRGYHPQVANANPLAIYTLLNDDDNIIRPGEAVELISQIRNSLPDTIVEGTLQTEVPLALGGGTRTTALNLATDQEMSSPPIVLRAAPNAQTQRFTIATSVQGVNITVPGNIRQFEPRVEQQVPVNPAYPPRQASVAPGLGQRTDSFAVYAETQSTANSGADLFRGEVRVAPVVGTGTTVVDEDVSSQDFVRGFAEGVQGSSRIACNATGRCFVVWADAAECSTLTINSLRVVTAGTDNGTPGIEPAISITLNDGGGATQFLWRSTDFGIQDVPSGTTITNRFPVERRICRNDGQVWLQVQELDEQPQLIEQDRNYGYLRNTSGTFRFAGFGHVIDLDLRMETHFEDVAGSLVQMNRDSGGNPTVAVQGGRFSLTQITNDTVADYDPVVATNGNSFLVVWQRYPLSGTRDRTYTPHRFTNRASLVARAFDQNGTPLSNELVLDANLGDPGSIRQLLAARPSLAWDGTAYRVVWRSEKSGSTPALAPGIYTIRLGATGTVVEAATRFPDSENDRFPQLAHSLRDGRSLIVMQRGLGGNIYGSFNHGAGFQPPVLLANALGRQLPLASFDPISRSWLVAWHSGGGIHYRALDLSGSPHTDVARIPDWGNSHVSGLACPAGQSAPVVDIRFVELAGTTSFRNLAGGEPATCANPDTCPGTGVFSDRVVGTGLRRVVSASFDGNDAVTLPNAENLNIQGPITLAAWVRPQASDGFRTIIAQGPTFNPNREVSLRINNNRYQVGAWTGSENFATSTSLVSNDIGRWVYLVGTYDGTTWRLYRNGAEVGAHSSTVGAQIVNSPWRIGADSGVAGGRFFVGTLDSVRIYPVALDPPTIQRLYNGLSTSFCLLSHPNQTAGRVDTAQISVRDAETTIQTLASNSANVQLTIDNDQPIARVTSLTNNQYISGGRQIITVAGEASDPTSSVIQVAVSVNGDQWRIIQGKEAWAFDLNLGNLPDGRNTIQAQAWDRAGNGPHPGPITTFFIDSNWPEITSDVPTGPQQPVRNAAGQWVLPLTGAVSASAFGGQPGSGIERVEVELQGRILSGGGEEETVSLPTISGCGGNGWQVATVANGRWSLNYIFAGTENPTGEYNIYARVTDTLGRLTQTSPELLALDAQGPLAALTYTGPQTITQVITQPVTFGGLITETGDVTTTAGLSSLEWSLVPAERASLLAGIRANTVLDLNLDEPAGRTVFADTAGQNNVASCTGDACPTLVTAGRVGAARRFDGTNDVLRLASPNAATVPATITLAAWVRPTRTDGIQYVVSKGPHPDPRAEVALRINANRYEIGAWNGTDHWAAFDIPAGDVNQWVHLAGVYDGTAWRLYRNGQLVATHTTSVGVLPVNAPWTIGGYTGPFGPRFFAGDIDQVVIFNRALHAAEVGALLEDSDRVWRPATLARSGDGVLTTTWSAAMPTGIEGFVQIDLRGTDTLGNRNEDRATWLAWRGEVDTLAPRVSITGPSNPTPGVPASYTCEVRDLNLDATSYNCPAATTAVPLQDSNRIFYDTAWWREFTAGTSLQRLIGINQTVSSVPPTQPQIRACDRYGRCATTSTTQPLGTIPVLTGGTTAALAATDALLSMTLQEEPPVLSGGVVAPIGGTVLTSTAPVSLTVAAFAAAGLQDLTLTANGETIATFDYATPLTLTTSTTTWTPPGEGLFALATAVRDRSGGITTTLPITVGVDMQPPTVAITTEVLAGFGQREDAFLLRGTATDATAVREVQVRVGAGEWAAARLTGNTWDYGMGQHLDLRFAADATTGRNRVVTPDSEQITVTVRAVDSASRTAERSGTVLVDMATPAPVSVTLTYDDGNGGRVPFGPYDVVRTVPARLHMAWQASSDGSGQVEYAAGFTPNPTATFDELTSYAGAEEHTQEAGEAEIRYAHLLLRDRYGNVQAQTLGPIYVDSPVTPDLTLASAPQTGGASTQQTETAPELLRDYDSWLNSGCSLLGVDWTAARREMGGTPRSEQRLNATWDSTALRLSWSGANWEGDGDLFFYFDSVPNQGTLQAYNPYTYTVAVDGRGNGAQTLFLPMVAQGGTGAASTLNVPPTVSAEPPAPGERPTFALPFAADYVLQLESPTSMTLLRWDTISHTWTVAAPFPANDFAWFDAVEQQTHLYLPFAELGITNPATSGLGLLALATEEDRLRVWSTVPARNPMNSPRMLNTALDGNAADIPFAMPRALTWDSLAANVCPSEGKYSGSDVQIVITPDKPGLVYSFLGDTLFHIQSKLLDKKDGFNENLLTYLQRNYPPVLIGQQIAYTVQYQNRGVDVARGVKVRIHSFDPVRLDGAQRITKPEVGEIDELILELGDLSPGTQGTHTVTGRLDPASDGQRMDRASLDIAIFDAIAEAQTPVVPIEWIWVDHAIDRTPPDGLTMTEPAATVTSGNITVAGAVADAGGVATLAVEWRKGQGVVQRVECADATPLDGQWTCPVDLGTVQQGDTFDLRVQATDTSGQSSAFSAWRTITVDTMPPTVGLSASTRDAIALGVIGPRDALFSGTVTDETQPDAVELCRTPAGSTDPSCTLVPVVASSTAPTATWNYALPLLEEADGVSETLTLTGLDRMGNRATAPLRVGYRTDSVPPVISVTQRLERIALVDYAPDNFTSTPLPVLGGTVRDGAGVSTVDIIIQRPDGEFTTAIGFYDGDTTWNYTPRLTVAGTYTLRVQARDLAGNVRTTEALTLEVTE